MRPGFESLADADTVGVWQCEVVHSTAGVAKKVIAAKMKAQDFACMVEPAFDPGLHSDPSLSQSGLYAAAGSFLEKGKRPYWLLKALTKGYKAPPGGLKSTVGTIRAGMWIIDAYWYVCTSDGQVELRPESNIVSGLLSSPFPLLRGCDRLDRPLPPQDRKSYKLLVEKDEDGKDKPPERVHIAIGALVQEHRLHFDRDFGPYRESILSNDSHLAVMAHVAFLSNTR